MSVIVFIHEDFVNDKYDTHNEANTTEMLHLKIKTSCGCNLGHLSLLPRSKSVSLPSLLWILQLSSGLQKFKFYQSLFPEYPISFMLQFLYALLTQSLLIFLKSFWFCCLFICTYNLNAQIDKTKSCLRIHL